MMKHRSRSITGEVHRHSSSVGTLDLTITLAHTGCVIYTGRRHGWLIIPVVLDFGLS